MHVEYQLEREELFDKHEYKLRRVMCCECVRDIHKEECWTERSINDTIEFVFLRCRGEGKIIFMNEE